MRLHRAWPINSCLGLRYMFYAILISGFLIIYSKMGDKAELDVIVDNLRNFKSITEKQIKLITEKATAIFL